MARTQIRGNTQIMTGTITNTQIASDAGIDYSKLDLTGHIANADVAADAAIAYSKLNLAASILNSDFGEAIDYTSLDLTGDIVNADIGAAAAIAYSKLNLAASILNSDLGEAIDYTSLDLTGDIVNADVNAAAAIDESKIAFDTTNGHNHDGTNSRIIAGSVAGKFDVSREEPTGDIDGTNADFTLASTPDTGSEHVWLNGQLQQEGTDKDYTIATKVISFVDAPETGARIVVSYGTA